MAPLQGSNMVGAYEAKTHLSELLEKVEADVRRERDVPDAGYLFVEAPGLGKAQRAHSILAASHHLRFERPGNARRVEREHLSNANLAPWMDQRFPRALIDLPRQQRLHARREILATLRVMRAYKHGALSGAASKQACVNHSRVIHRQ